LETGQPFPVNALSLEYGSRAATAIFSRSLSTLWWKNDAGHHHYSGRGIYAHRTACLSGYISCNHWSGVHSAELLATALPGRNTSTELLPGSPARPGPNRARRQRCRLSPAHLLQCQFSHFLSELAFRLEPQLPWYALSDRCRRLRNARRFRPDHRNKRHSPRSRLRT